MKLIRFDIHRYKAPTSLGFTREGLYITLTTDSGKKAVGEIAPLPGRSPETLDEAIHFTKLLKERFLKQDFSPTRFPPSVLFGMEMAMLDLLSPHTPTYTTYKDKIKLKNLSLEEAIHFCKQASKPLRIDINRKWPLTQVLSFCSHFKPTDFFYIEDPTETFAELETFYEATGFPYAVDEYLEQYPLEQILTLKGLTHFIIKPTLHGGLTQCKKFLNQGKTCIFTSAYETEIGLKHIARIGSHLSPKEPVGIDTLSIFTQSPETYMVKQISPLTTPEESSH